MPPGFILVCMKVFSVIRRQFSFGKGVTRGEYEALVEVVNSLSQMVDEQGKAIEATRRKVYRDIDKSVDTPAPIPAFTRLPNPYLDK